MNIEETIFFYTRNDYLIVNNFLCGNMKNLWEVAYISNNDSKGMLKEHQDGIRTLDDKTIEKYKNRIFESLNDDVKTRIINNAKTDIRNILNAMKPSEKEMLLYRTVWHVRFGDLVPCYQKNQEISFKNISSTSIMPYREDIQSNFYRYEITVPKNGLVLELNQFDNMIRNEEGEVLLPPMKCKVKNIRNNENKYCKGIIELQYLEML